MGIDHQGSTPLDPFLDGLKPEIKEALLQTCKHAFFEPGVPIVREGEQGQEIFVLLSGCCQVRIGDESVSDLRPGELFGEIGALSEGVRTATVTAQERSEVLIVPSDTELLQNPSSLQELLKRILTRTRSISARDLRA